MAAIQFFAATTRRYHYRATGGDMPAGSFTLDPRERQPKGIDLRGQLPAGRVISRATVSAIDLADNTSATAILAQPTRTTDYTAEIDVKSLVHGHRYKITYVITDSAGSLYVETLIAIGQTS